ncbi:hypothetical protein [aff. Roholtiella sp. LEGE 12411]|nr:hypothetical protein [aff. Roholtiella sp. LEGE 12411]
MTQLHSLIFADTLIKERCKYISPRVLADWTTSLHSDRHTII